MRGDRPDPVEAEVALPDLPMGRQYNCCPNRPFNSGQIFLGRSSFACRVALEGRLKRLL